MGLHANTAWEMRTTGSNTNGGLFYNRNPGTSVDYSQQAAAQLALSDIATDGAGTTLASATGGFTAAMAGNGIYLTGGGATAGWYEITAYTDTNTVTIDRSAGASKTGVTGNVGGCLALLTQAVLDAMVTRNVMHVKSGTYTATGSVDGQFSPGNNLAFVGYKTTREDSPEGNDRPLLAMGANALRLSHSGYWHHFRMTTTNFSGLYCDDGTTCNNVSVASSATPIGPMYPSAITTESHVRFHRTEARSNGWGIYQGGYQGMYVSDSHIHAVKDAIYLDGGGYNSYVYNTILVSSLAAGVYVAVNCNGLNVKRCAFYDSAYGLRFFGEDRRVIVEDSLFDSCATGISVGSSVNGSFYNRNNYHGNTNDVSGISKGPNATTHDPDFEDAANGDFRLKAGSSCLTAGTPVALGTGGNSVTTHQGAVPPEPGGGGGGSGGRSYPRGVI